MKKPKPRVKRRASKKPCSLENQVKLRLPADYCWKVLGACLEDLRQYLPEEDSQRLDGIIRRRSISDVISLSDEWNLQCMNSTHTSIVELRVKYQLAALLKKFQFDEGNAQARQDSAIKKFIISEIYCNKYNRSGHRALTNSTDQKVRHIFTYARAWIQKVIGHELPDEGILTLRSRHGPGAASNTSNGNTSKYFKYSEWPYDVTARAKDLAISSIKADKRWWGALEDDYRRRYKIPKAMILDQQVFWDNVLNVVPGNKVAFVPKSFQTDRTIAIEPTLNLYLQLGVDGFIRRRLKRWGIDLDDQSINGEMARQGSRNDGDDSFVTLDLAMASDSISIAICRYLLPDLWFQYLMDLRSPTGELGGKTIPYGKISSMGNGFTFALESLIFAALTYAAIKYQAGFVPRRSFSVYGDDIIVPKRFVKDVILALNVSGFQLNLDKSFLEGPVRESCGSDWFLGYPVRPVFLKTRPRHLKELFNDRNRLYRQFKLRFGFKPESVDRLYQSWIPSKFKNFVGPLSDEEFDTYIHSSKETYWEHGHWHFKRLIRRPQLFRGKKVGNLHFRKLMASLSDHTDFSDRSFASVDRNFTPRGYALWHSTINPGTKVPWLKDADIGGSTFEVPRSKTWYFATSYSTADFWRQSYAEVGAMA